MSEISGILEKLKGTKEAEILEQMENAYARISREQKEWYETSKFYCPEGCGTCCHGFEPDIMEGEALYMAAWLLENQNQTALNAAEGKLPYDNGKTCPFHDYDNPYHCTIYGGRAFICRLFGASCALDKKCLTVWKPCKFLSDEQLHSYDKRLEHRQYSESEASDIIKKMPPAMSSLMEQALSFTPDHEQTTLIRDCIGNAVRRILWLESLNSPEQTDTQTESEQTN